MNESILKKYYDMIDSLNNNINKITNNQIKEYSKNKLVEFINGLYKIENNNENLYIELFNKYNLPIDSFIYEKKDINKDLEKYENELKNIFLNPNEESIKVWLNNIIEYSNELNISEQELNDYIVDKFNLYDTNNEYTNNLEKYINEIKNKKVLTEETKENTSLEDDIEEEHSFEKPLEEDTFESENSNEENLEEEKKLENIDETEMEDKPLKIINKKKSFNSKLKNKGLILSALTGLGLFTISPVWGTVLSFAGYKLYKMGIKNAKKLIEKNGYYIDENDELTNENGKIITDEDIGIIKYKLVRRELEKREAGRIDKDYKKNRLTSMLLNNNITNNIRDRFETIKEDDYESPQLVKDINNGMRNA